MKRVYLLAFSLVCFLSLEASAGVTIKNLKFKSDKNKGTMTINYSGNLNDYPEMKVNQNSIYVIVPEAKVKRAINKKVNFATKKKDTKLQAAQFTGKSSRVKVILPFNINTHKEKVSLTIRDNNIELTFPKLKASSTYLAAAGVKTKAKKAARPTAKVAKKLLNEDYLNGLIAEQKKKKVAKKAVKKSKINSFFNTQSKKVSKKTTDIVKTGQAAPAKSFIAPGKSSFSLVEYGGKFVAFLGVVLLLFYGVVTLIKKGVIKKGKLGFLNKTEQVTVLSQTHIAPKKSLMMIRAHNQVFLVSNTDAGIHPISEIKDVAGLLKDGELKIAGDNFDTNILEAGNDSLIDNKVKLKEDITQSNKQSSLSDFIGVQDKVKFSDSLKKKVKSLKPLQ